jgi:trehalose 6-phosphate synthase
MVRERVPRARLLHFVHIPWPRVGIWRRLPPEIARRIHEGLAANDVIGFQTERDAQYFLESATYFLRGARYVGAANTLLWRGRRVHVGVYPIALSPTTVVTAARSSEAEAAAEAILEQVGLDRGRQLILRVDRMEPTKNIVRGFDAYERLLVAHPELRGRVVFLALLVPSREGLRAYQHYAAMVQQTIARINAAYGREGWQPIIAVSGNDHRRALACMRHCDVLLVNPLIDGMNLVAKEAGLVNERNGTIVLSREAGAYTQLAAGVLGVDPCDVAATTDAIYTALTLPHPERAALAKRVRDVLLSECADCWLDQQLTALADATEFVLTDAALDSESWVTPHHTAPLDGLEELAAESDVALGYLTPPGRTAPRLTIPLT